MAAIGFVQEVVHEMSSHVKQLYPPFVATNEPVVKNDNHTPCGFILKPINTACTFVSTALYTGVQWHCYYLSSVYTPVGDSVTHTANMLVLYIFVHSM